MHTFRIRKTCTCVTFNTWPPVCHIIYFPPMCLKRNTTTRLLNLRTLLCVQLLTYETVFEYIVWRTRRTVRRVHCKKRHNFTQRFDLQGHARVQIFTYKDVSVCNVSPNLHMFNDKRRVSTQISRLCHVELIAAYARRHIRVTSLEWTWH